MPLPLRQSGAKCTVCGPSATVRLWLTPSPRSMAHSVFCVEFMALTITKVVGVLFVPVSTPRGLQYSTRETSIFFSFAPRHIWRSGVGVGESASSFGECLIVELETKCVCSSPLHDVLDVRPRFADRVVVARVHRAGLNDPPHRSPDHGLPARFNLVLKQNCSQLFL